MSKAKDERSMQELKRELCQFLVKIDALKFGMFTLTSGRTSPYYIDLRLVPSYPEIFDKVVDIYAELVRHQIGLNAFERIAGIPTAGMPFSAGLSLKVKKPFLYIRRGVRDHGTGRLVEGILMPGDRVLIVDDLVTTGKSTMEAVSSVVREGGLVTDVLVLIDREEGAKETLKREGVKLHSLMTVSEASRLLNEIGLLDDDKLKAILKQVGR